MKSTGYDSVCYVFQEQQEYYSYYECARTGLGYGVGVAGGGGGEIKKRFDLWNYELSGRLQ